MARKPRDYHAEYVRDKERATNAGYSSPREYKRVRAALKLPRNAAPIPKRILLRNTDEPITRTASNWAQRRDAETWSREHSRQASSKYKPSLSSESLGKYDKAFVHKNPDKEKWKRDLYDYLYDGVDDAPDYAEWEEDYFAK